VVRGYVFPFSNLKDCLKIPNESLIAGFASTFTTESAGTSTVTVFPVLGSTFVIFAVSFYYKKPMLSLKLAQALQYSSFEFFNFIFYYYFLIYCLQYPAVFLETLRRIH
jgi:hypothetical protein